MTDFICPEARYHGNPFRYCGVKGCGWMEEPEPPQPSLAAAQAGAPETTRQRYWMLSDGVFKKLAAGDVLGLLELAGNIANGCDYVDDETIELHRRAVELWAPIQAAMNAASHEPPGYRLPRPNGANPSGSDAR